MFAFGSSAELFKGTFDNNMKHSIILLLSLVFFSFCVVEQDDTMTVASYNLRYNTSNDGENAWPNRVEMVKELIRYHEFDVFGTQEGLVGQLRDLEEMSEYTWYGRGRDDGKRAGEFSAIFYKKDRFKLLDKGDFWLNEKPGKPRLGWDAACKRICTWVKLKDRQTKKTFYFFNVHFDQKGEVARTESGKLMVAMIKEIAHDEPVICVGDFNSLPEDTHMKELTGLLHDSYVVSETAPYGPVGTFNGFQLDAPLQNRIDYIFVSDDVMVKKYATLTDNRFQRYPSDHLPVVVQVEIK